MFVSERGEGMTVGWMSSRIFEKAMVETKNIIMIRVIFCDLLLDFIIVMK